MELTYLNFYYLCFRVWLPVKETTFLRLRKSMTFGYHGDSSYHNAMSLSTEACPWNLSLCGVGVGGTSCRMFRGFFWNIHYVHWSGFGTKSYQHLQWTWFYLLVSLFPARMYSLKGLHRLISAALWVCCVHCLLSPFLSALLSNFPAAVDLLGKLDLCTQLKLSPRTLSLRAGSWSMPGPPDICLLSLGDHFVLVVNAQFLENYCLVYLTWAV